VGFLWQLLPGARETRNQVIVGYVWLFAIALWTGVPAVTKGSHLHELLDAMGPLGVGVALSFCAFLLGSLSYDLTGQLFGTRGARALSRFSDAPPVLTIRRMEEWGIRAELERLEASIDRANAEVLLRVGLIPPVLASGAAGTRSGWYWAVAAGITSAAISWQTLRRRSELVADLQTSDELRGGIAQSLEPELREMRATEETERAAGAERSRKEAEKQEIERREQDAAVEAEHQRRLRELQSLEAREASGRLDEAASARLAELREWKRKLDERMQELERRTDELRARTEKKKLEMKAHVEEARRRISEGTAAEEPDGPRIAVWRRRLRRTRRFRA
jgi:hypothetical protein